MVSLLRWEPTFVAIEYRPRLICVGATAACSEQLPDRLTLLLTHSLSVGQPSDHYYQVHRAPAAKQGGGRGEP
jgi:hypothetical protein